MSLPSNLSEGSRLSGTSSPNNTSESVEGESGGPSVRATPRALHLKLPFLFLLLPVLSPARSKGMLAVVLQC